MFDAAPGISSVDTALRKWGQGDFALGGDIFFIHLAHLSNPLTPEAIAAAELEPDAGGGVVGVPTTQKGVVIVTQTCDIVREAANRPYVEVSPLVEVTPEQLEEIRRLQRPRYAFIPGAASLRLVADLDRTMTVEKAVLAGLTREGGCRDDTERRSFADALARKKSRFAFPDDFSRAFSKVSRRIKRRHSKDSVEGALARALREIRVRAAPGWDDQEVRLSFLFILDDEQPPPTPIDDAQVDGWLKLFDTSGKFKLDLDLPYRLCFLEDVDARSYIESDRIDLDSLSVSLTAGLRSSSDSVAAGEQS
ncbi:hypothetical protein ACVFYP_22445 [Roseomonas sp. F4]